MRSDGRVPVDRQLRHVAQQTVDQAVEEFVSSADVPVDRRDGHPELLGERTHREGLDTVAFDEPSRRVEHRLGVDRLLIAAHPAADESEG